MKSDKYLKVILTIIAICLIWICVKDIKIGPQKLYASGSSFEVQDVRIVDVEIPFNKAILTKSIPVNVINWPYHPLPEDK